MHNKSTTKSVTHQKPTGSLQRHQHIKIIAYRITEAITHTSSITPNKRIKCLLKATESNLNTNNHHSSKRLKAQPKFDLITKAFQQNPINNETI